MIQQKIKDGIKEAMTRAVEDLTKIMEERFSNQQSYVYNIDSDVAHMKKKMIRQGADYNDLLRRINEIDRLINH